MNNALTSNKDISEFKDIHIFKIFLRESDDNLTENIFKNYQPKRSNPFI